MDNPNKTQDRTASGRKKRRILPRILAAAILLGVVFSVNHFASVSFDKARVSDYYRSDMNRLEKAGTDIDMIILGASQVYHGCNTELIARELGMGGEVIDCASAGAFCDGMYYMLKDILHRFTPKYVMIDLPWTKFVDQTSSSTSRYLSSDRMKLGGKLDYIIHCLTPEEGFTVLFPLYRFGRSVWGVSQLKNHFLTRKAIREGNWEDEADRKYRKNGFVWEYKSCPEGGIPAELFLYSEDVINHDYVEYVRKMVNLCKEKQIPVSLMTMPASTADLYGIENYQASADYMQSLADELGCMYLNFNLVKGREEFLPDTCFWDTRHMNGDGSTAFAPVFADIVKKAFNGEDTNGLFYDNLEEMKKNVHRIVACNANVTPNEDGTLSVSAWSLQNDDITPQYRLGLVESSPDDAVDGEDRIQELCPWQEEGAFLVDRSSIPEGYMLRVEARQKGNEKYDACQNLPGAGMA